MGCIEEFTPPNPITVAPPINPTIPTSFPDAIGFIYHGPNPIQQGLSGAVIEEHRTAVLKGIVKGTDGAPLPGVLVRVLDHPEFGYTYSRADGAYDLVVNGGGELTLDFQKAGFLRSQRVETTPWWQWQYYEDVVMVAFDTAATVVQLGPSMSGTIHVGSPISDTDGNRRATVYFPPGTQAQLVSWDGSHTPLSSINVRATEYTVGPLGRERMPGTLPETSDYTYAVELSADEAVAANAKTVEFSQPIVLLVENFLGYPVGEGVPLGHYDFRAGSWLPSDDGNIVKVIMISGGLAILDVDGSGQPASNAALIALGISDAERERIALAYPAGAELWRSRIDHFTPWDCNWGGLPPEDAEPPPAPEPPEDGDDPCPPGQACPDGNDDNPDANAEDEDGDDPCENIQAGSVIECDSQTLKEFLPIKGTPFSLVYSSDRVPDVQNRLIHSGFRFRVPVTGAQVSPNLVEAQVEVTMGGHRRLEVFTSLIPSFVYEGFVPYTDVYGRGVPGEGLTGIQGTAAYCAKVRLYYRPVPAATVPGFQNFAIPSGLEMGPDRSRGLIYYQRTVCSESRGRVTRYSPPSPSLWDARGVGNGGWTMDVHHAYDPTSNKLIYGTGRTRELGYGEPLRLDVIRSVNADVYLDPSADLAVSADGSVLTFVQVPKSHNWNLVRVDPVSGVSVAIAETCVPSGGPEECDGAPLVGNFSSVTAFESGSVAVSIGRKIYMLRSDGTLSTAFDGAIHSPQCTPAHLTNWRGSIYFACSDEGWIGRLWPGGPATRFAGPGTNSAEGAPALQADVGEIVDLAIDATGEVYFANPSRVRRITRGGNVETVAGGTTTGDSDDQVLASTALLGTVSSIAIASDGFVYIAEDSRQGRIREVRDTGYLYTSIGGGSSGLPVGTELARRVSLNGSTTNQIAIAPDGTMFLKAQGTLFKQIRSTYMAQGENTRIRIASEDGAEVFVFNRDGRHLETRYALTNALKYQFIYNGGGYLISIADGDGNITLLQRDAGNRLTAVVTADGLTSSASVDTRGWLLSFSDPLQHAWQMTYSDGGHLRSFTNPRMFASTFGYDVNGGLAFDENAENGRWDLTGYAYGSTQASTVDMQTAEGRRYTYSSNRGPSGSFAKISLTPEGRSARYYGTNGTMTEEIPYLRTRVTTQQNPDPRFQMDSPYTSSRTVEIKDGEENALVRQTTVSIEAFESGGQVPFDLRQSVQVNGRNRLSLFNASDRSWLSISARGRRTNVTLDEQTRPTRLGVAGLEPIDLAYDPRGRPASIAQGQGAVMRVSDFTYAANGTLASITDAELRTTEFDIDDGGRVHVLRLPGDRQVLFEHNDTDQITSITPPGRPAHVFDYDDIGRLIAYRPPSLGVGDYSTHYTYDRDNRLTRIDRPDGRSVVLDYEGALVIARLSAIVTHEGQYSLSYRPGTPQSPWNAQLAQINAPGNVNLGFEWIGQRPQRVRWSGPISGEVAYAYDDNFWLHTLTIVGQSTSYGYDGDGLLTSVGALSLTRSTQNTQLLGTTLGAVNDDWTYNPFGEPESYEVRINGAGFYRTEYTRDKLARITEKRETVDGLTSVFQYDYDLAGRLDQVRRNGQLLSDYAFDGNSNRTQWTRPPSAQANDCLQAGDNSASYDDQDRMVTYGRCSFDYSAAGDLRRKTRIDSGAVTDYTYDDFGNLRRVGLPNGDTIDYLIDGLNRRVGKRVNGSLVQGFLYMNQLEPVAELDGSGQVRARFIYADRPHVPAYILKGSETYRVIADHLGSVRFVVNTSTGDIAQAIDYDEYGRVLSDSNPGFQPFGFAGGLDDRDTGWVRFGARDYDASSGRWSTPDRMRIASSGFNGYFYCANNPTGCLDISGLVELALAACTQSEIDFARGWDSPDFDVTAHGRKDPWGNWETDRGVHSCKNKGKNKKDLTPTELADRIRSQPGYDESVTINLLVCGSANGDYPLAKQIHDLLGNPTIGYRNEVVTTIEQGVTYGTPVEY